MTKLPHPGQELFYEAILSLRTPQECCLFFRDICTIKEQQAMIQRFAVACGLDAGRNYIEVGQTTGASSATISRVSKCLNYGDGGYAIALERLKEEGKIGNEGNNSEK